MGRWCIVGRVCFGIMFKKEGISVWLDVCGNIRMELSSDSLQL